MQCDCIYTKFHLNAPHFSLNVLPVFEQKQQSCNKTSVILSEGQILVTGKFQCSSPTWGFKWNSCNRNIPFILSFRIVTKHCLLLQIIYPSHIRITEKEVSHSYRQFYNDKEVILIVWNSKVNRIDKKTLYFCIAYSIVLWFVKLSQMSNFKGTCTCNMIQNTSEIQQHSSTYFLSQCWQ